MHKENTDKCEHLVKAKQPFYDTEIDIERGCSFKATHGVIFLACPSVTVRLCGRHTKAAIAPRFKNTARELTEEEKLEGWYSAYH
jgi:hypothetical protein